MRAPFLVTFVLTAVTASASAQIKCALVKDIRKGPSNSSPISITCCVGKTLYFEASNGLDGDELWKTDESGTSMVRDINPGAGDSNPRNFTSGWTAGRLVTVFTATGSRTQGTELWKTDGTAKGTSLVKDIRPGAFSSLPDKFVVCDNKIYFVADDGRNGVELWRTDGTASGTVMVKDINKDGSSDPSSFVCCKGVLYFSATNGSDNGDNGRELWKSNGTASGTVMVKDIEAGSGESSPRNLVSFGDKIVFTAFTTKSGSELFISDGTATGTQMLKDTNGKATTSGSPANLTKCRIGGSNTETLFFTADNGVTGTELWKSDLTATGTTLVKDVVGGTSGSAPHSLVCSEGKLFFSASADGKTGRELYVSDGTATGTVLVKDINPGSGSSSPAELTSAGKGVFFTADDGKNGTELWFSDGTATGTSMVCDLFPGLSSSSVSELTCCSGVVYFSANDGKIGTELYRVMGTPGTVEVVGEGCESARAILGSTNPRIDNSMSLFGACAPGDAGLLLIGYQSDPRNVSGVVHPRCVVWVDTLGIFALHRQPAGSNWSWKIDVPNEKSCIGSKLVMQSVYGRGFPLSVSNAVVAVIGPDL